MTLSIISKTNEYIYIAIVYRWMDKKLFIEKMRKSMEIFNIKIHIINKNT